MAENHHIQDVSLFNALLMLENIQEAKALFNDLYTPQEIKALKERWRVIQLLENKNLSYREIHKITGASLTNIGRVARFLKDESYRGYKNILEKNQIKERKMKKVNFININDQ